MKTQSDASRGRVPVRRILRQYISITHKKKNKSFEVAERADYSREENNKEALLTTGVGSFSREPILRSMPTRVQLLKHF